MDTVLLAEHRGVWILYGIDALSAHRVIPVIAGNPVLCRVPPGNQRCMPECGERRGVREVGISEHQAVFEEISKTAGFTLDKAVSEARRDIAAQLVYRNLNNQPKVRVIRAGDRCGAQERQGQDDYSHSFLHALGRDGASRRSLAEPVVRREQLRFSPLPLRLQGGSLLGKPVPPGGGTDLVA